MKQLYFIGSPRTGSTLLGQIMNYHPNCLISNESRYLQKVIEKGQDKNSAMQEMINDAYLQFNSSLENTQRFASTIKTYQPKWQSFSKFKDNESFTKKEILLIGDKKAGGNIHVYRNNKEKFNDFIKNENPYFLMIIRNPAETALSYMKSHGSGTIEDALRKTLTDTLDAYELGVTQRQFKIVHYEGLTDNTEEFLKLLFDFVTIETTEQWRKEISTIVNNDKVDVSKEVEEISQNILRTEFSKISHIFDKVAHD